MKASIDRRPWLVLAGLSLLAGGCGGDAGRVPLVPATGTVRVDGQPAEGVEVRFHPAEGAGDPDALTPFATTGAGGEFRLGTYEGGDGAPAGRYRVTLFWPDGPPGPSPSQDRLQGAYAVAARSGLEVTIAEAGGPLGPIEVKKPAPPRKRAAAPRRPRQPDLDGLGEPPPG